MSSSPQKGWANIFLFLAFNITLFLASNVVVQKVFGSLIEQVFVKLLISGGVAVPNWEGNQEDAEEENDDDSQEQLQQAWRRMARLIQDTVRNEMGNSHPWSMGGGEEAKWERTMEFTKNVVRDMMEQNKTKDKDPLLEDNIPIDGISWDL